MKMTAIPNWSDRKMEEVIGGLLQIGVSISALVVLFGGAIYLVRHGFSIADYHTFRGEPEELRTVHGVINSVRAGRARGIIQLGLLILIATPVVRVAFSIWGFAAERDRMYVVFTGVVLTILLYSLLGSSH